MTAERGPDERVVVTGLGLVTPLGNGRTQVWEAALAGRSGARRITRFDPEHHGCQIACEVPDFDPEDHMERKTARRSDRATQLAVAASRLAVEDAGLDSPQSERAGIVMATGSGGNETFEAAHKQLRERGPERMSPLAVPTLIANMPAGQASIELGLQGPCWCIVTACASGTHAIGEASEVLRRGEADVMIAGGTEAGITPYCVAALDATRALSRRNDDPEAASRPFDVDRDGFVPAEGAAVLVLETLAGARKRGARVLCELTGYGATADAYHLTEPHPSGRYQAAAMRAALEEGGLSPEDVDYVNAHGTSTPSGDGVEVMAIRSVLGDEHAARTAVSSTKSMHGHGMGAAGGFEAALTVLAIHEGAVPPTINLDRLDADCSGVDHVANTARRVEVRTALSNSFGFGGHNAVVAFAAIED